jgi:hypothetical protein
MTDVVRLRAPLGKAQSPKPKAPDALMTLSCCIGDDLKLEGCGLITAAPASLSEQRAMGVPFRSGQHHSRTVTNARSQYDPANAS